MNYSHTSHIVVRPGETGEVFVDVDDYELFDFVSDYLTEGNGISYDFLQEVEIEGRKYHRAILKNYSFEKIKIIIEKLSVNEIERIYQINN